MKAIRALEIALSGFGEAALHGGFSPPAEMKRYAHELDRRFGSPDSDRPRVDRREPVLIRLLAQYRIESARDIKYICYGLADPIGSNKQSVLGDTRAFSVLLRHVQTLEQYPKRLRRCYLGLLSAYFEFDSRDNVDENTGTHWLKLRDYLSRNLNSISSATPVPQWAIVLKEHRNLLGENPCERYAKQLLDGKSDAFESMRRALNVSGNSWVVSEAAFAAIEFACREAEDRFLNRIPTLIEMMRRYPVIQSKALAIILGRYATMRNRPEHRVLCHFAVSLWGNPLLRKNLKNWDVTGKPATDMVALWLKANLIEDFFELLSADGKTDKRRVKFWKRYVEVIEDMYFAFGKNALATNREDVNRLRTTMGDNLLRLEGGASSNNGFFMVIGNHLIAEFGEKGNATFIFKKDSLPFQLNGTVSLSNRTRWSDKAEARLRHFDRAHAQWEEDFEESLRQIVGVTPSSVPSLRRSPSGSTRPQPEPQQAVAKMNIDTLRSLCAQHGLRFQDHRTARCFVVRASDNNKQVAALLTEYSFEYDAVERCWCLNY